MAQRTFRHWHPIATVGLVGPNDIKTLQARVHDYRNAIQASIDLAAAQGRVLLPLDQSQYSVQAWSDTTGRSVAFETESTAAWNPLAYLYAGTAWDRGRDLIEELDRWRDHLDALKAPSVPAPVPVPHADLGIAGGIGYALFAILAIFAFRDLHK